MASGVTFDSIANKYIVGLTGGIGSGKTAVSDWFAQQGIAVVDADVIAHQIVAKGTSTLNELVVTFGDWVLDDSGNLNRQAMRDYVFNKDNALKKLEGITHPAIRLEIIRQLKSSTSPYVILSAPLLLENPDTALKSVCDRILVVDVDEATQLERASGRDGQSVEKIRAIMTKQLSRQRRLEQADDVVDNNGTFAELYAQLKPLHQSYLNFANT